MSATNETAPKKRGRPKKVKTEIPAVAVSTDNSKAEAAKAVAEILSQASAKASEGVSLVSPVSIDNATTGASSHDALDAAQGDYIPGTRVLDIQMVPRRAFDEDMDNGKGGVREVGRPDEYHYCWVHTDKITQFRINGYKFVQYNGGNQSGLAPGGFSGTGIYERTFDNHVRNGDMLLMWISKRQFEAQVDEDRKYSSRLESAAEDEIHNSGYARGIRTFKEKDGVTLYN